MSLSKAGRSIHDGARRWLRWAMAPVIVVVVAIGLHATGNLDWLEHRLMDVRFGLLGSAPSGDTVIVDIDARSLHQIERWPWPRSYHAELVERLSAAGAAQIALDIDFSSRSDPADDAALVEAVRNADSRVLLPVFKQWLGARRDTLVFTEPFEELREAADDLAAVNVRPSGDSLVRRYQRYVRWPDALLPTFGRALAGDAAADDRRAPYYLDFGIRIEETPRVSFVDVLEGRFASGTFSGRTVIVGATAVELGDQLAVPIYGALSGVELQALARESLLLGRDIQRAWAFVPYALVLVAAAAVPWFRRISWWSGLAGSGIATASLFGMSLGVQSSMPLSVDVTPPLIALWIGYGWAMLARLEVLAYELFKRTMEARDRTAMLNAVLRENADGVLILDDGFRVKMINPAAEKLLRVKARRAEGRPVAEIMPIDDPHGLFDVELFDDTGSRHFETELKVNPDTEGLPIEVTAGSGALSLDNSRFERRTETRHVHFLIFRDISERRQVQEALVLAAEKAHEADRAKSEFIANVSHELRTPLNAIIGFSEVLRKQMFGDLGAPQYVEYAEDINLSGQHLLDLINDVLLVSKIDSGGHDIKERKIDIAMVTEACLRIVKGYPKAASLNFVTDIPEKLPTLSADERAFRQMLLNILSNAVKFTPAGGRVHIGIRVEALGDLMVTVTDTGIGIPSSVVAKVTDPFFQVEGAMERQYEGTGLGLSIVAKLAALHGAKVEIESREGIGTSVSVRFPPMRVMTAENVISLDAAKDRRQQS